MMEDVHDRSSLERSIDHTIRNLDPRYKPSDDTLALFRNRAGVIADSEYLRVLEKFRDITHHYQNNYEAERNLCTKFLNDYVTKALGQTTVKIEPPIGKRILEKLDTEENFRILNKAADHVSM